MKNKPVQLFKQDHSEQTPSIAAMRSKENEENIKKCVSWNYGIPIEQLTVDHECAMFSELVRGVISCTVFNENEDEYNVFFHTRDSKDVSKYTSVEM